MSELVLDLPEIPQGWVMAVIENIADVSGGYAFKSKDYSKTGRFILRTLNITKQGTISKNKSVFLPETLVENYKNVELEKDDILFVMVGEIGKIGYVTNSSLPALLNQNMWLIRSHIYPKFLFYALQNFSKLITEKSIGSTRSFVRRRDFKKMMIPIPPIMEQKRIVEKIEESFLKLSESKQILENIEKQISKFNNSYLKNIFEDKHNDTENWTVLPLSQLLKEPLKNGRSGKPTTSNDGIHVLKLTAVTVNDFSDSNIKFCNIDKNNLEDLWVKKKDILIERSNTPELVGISAIYEGHDNQFIFPDLMIRVRVNEEQILSNFLSLYLSYGKVRKYFQNRAKGISNSFPKICQNDINELKIPFPNVSKQKEIIKLIELNSLKLDILRKNRTKILNELSKLNHSILKQAFEGKLVPQDPNDEPAEILLQKIIQEKEQLIQKQKASRSTKNVK